MHLLFRWWLCPMRCSCNSSSRIGHHGFLLHVIFVHGALRLCECCPFLETISCALACWIFFFMGGFQEALEQMHQSACYEIKKCSFVNKARGPGHTKVAQPQGFFWGVWERSHILSDSRPIRGASWPEAILLEKSQRTISPACNLVVELQARLVGPDSTTRL